MQPSGSAGLSAVHISVVFSVSWQRWQYWGTSDPGETNQGIERHLWQAETWAASETTTWVTVNTLQRDRQGESKIFYERVTGSKARKTAYRRQTVHLRWDGNEPAVKKSEWLKQVDKHNYRSARKQHHLILVKKLLRRTVQIQEKHLISK